VSRLHRGAGRGASGLTREGGSSTDIGPHPDTAAWLPVDPIPAGLTFSQAWDAGLVAEGSLGAFGLEWAASQRSANTRRTYLSVVRTFCLFLAGGDEDRARGVPMGTLSGDAIATYLRRLEEGDPFSDPSIPARAGSTVAKVSAALCGLAERHGVSRPDFHATPLRSHPLAPITEHHYQLALRLVDARIEAAKEHNRCGAVSLPAEAVRAYRDRAVLRLLGDCGLRRSEAVALRVDDLYLASLAEAVRDNADGPLERAAGWIHVHNRERDEERWVPVPGQVDEALRAWLRERNRVIRRDDGPILLAGPTFRSDHRPRWRSLTSRQLFNIVRACTQAAGATGDSTRPQALRARYCSHLARSGLPVETIREFAGHASVRTTMSYVEIGTDPPTR
jgi:integrase